MQDMVTVRLVHFYPVVLMFYLFEYRLHFHIKYKFSFKTVIQYLTDCIRTWHHATIFVHRDCCSVRHNGNNKHIVPAATHEHLRGAGGGHKTSAELGEGPGCGTTETEDEGAAWTAPGTKEGTAGQSPAGEWG